MNEHDANRLLSLSVAPKPGEDDTQLMTFSERRYRAREARQMRLDWLAGRHGFITQAERRTMQARWTQANGL